MTAHVRALVPFLDSEAGCVRHIGRAFSCGEERAETLVAKGLVERCATSCVVRVPEPEPNPEPIAGVGAPEMEEVATPAASGGAGESAALAELPENLDDITREQLVAMAEALGVAVGKKDNKGKIASLIREATGEEE